ncbi:MAG: choice-of-anchor J domain-containing protein [Bacteroidales bacterium]|nr:choice-of-anchor J domain-containing protein [Bacteroidales bacterium]
MKKSFIIALLMVLMAPFATNAQTKDMWDLVTAFSTSTGRQHGIVYDGEHIYTAAWGKSSNVLYMFYKYDLEGNLLDQFDVPGVTNDNNYLRDMTFDGTYFYGCDAHSNKIWCYDLHEKTLVTSNIIETGLKNGQGQDKELGICTYDPAYDAFWVGERATGNSPSLHLDLYLINRSGEVVRTATPHNLGGHTVHGTGYFTDDEGVAHIYLFAVEGFTAHVFDYNIDEDTMSSNYIFDFSETPGWGVACTAGGAYIGEVDGSTYFFGDVDKSPNLIGIYALGDYTPVTPQAPDGDIFFDFNDGMMRWTTIDADDDGYNWEMRNNWGNTENPYSVTSASYDDATGLVLFPENYLVTPYKLDCEQITFKACAQDVNNPAEHVGVAVSTTGNTDAEDFTIIWDTDLTAKAGAWHSFNIDLRAYQGQDIYVAIVHFNCTDQFMINVDDIMLYRTYNDVAENTYNMFTVYPNPAAEKLVVESEITIDQYDIYTVTGAMILSKPVDEKSFEINVSELPAGTYLIKMSANGLVQTKRFVKE